MIKVGIIGAGAIVPSFIKATGLVKGYRQVGIAARNKEKLQQFKERYGIRYCTIVNDDLFNDPGIDVIYVAVPNHLHYELGKKALEHDKHVIMEKPFALTYEQAKELIGLARERKKIIFDATSVLHMPNYHKVKELLPELGELKLVDMDLSHYSSRYGPFKEGIILPAFDPRQGGGALFDLGIYNIAFCVGLFGKPQKTIYYPNIVRKVDTSGILVLDYGPFKVNAVCARDHKAPSLISIQGDEGRIHSDHPANTFQGFSFCDLKGHKKDYALNKYPEAFHYHEFREFKRLYEENDLAKAQEYNALTLQIMEVLEEARQSGNLQIG